MCLCCRQKDKKETTSNELGKKKNIYKYKYKCKSRTEKRKHRGMDLVWEIPSKESMFLTGVQAFIMQM